MYAVRQKHALYDEGFRGSRYDFAAMVFETSGAVNEEGRNILRQMIRFASKRECVGTLLSLVEHGLESVVAFSRVSRRQFLIATHAMWTHKLQQ